MERLCFFTGQAPLFLWSTYVRNASYIFKIIFSMPVYNINRSIIYSTDLKCLLWWCGQEAHDAEILSLHFTSVVVAEDNLVDRDSLIVSLLASGGRDRLVHIYDVNRWVLAKAWSCSSCWTWFLQECNLILSCVTSATWFMFLCSYSTSAAN